MVAKGDEVPEDVKESRKVLVYSWQWTKDDVYVPKGLTQLSDHPVHLGITVDGGLREYFVYRNTFWCQTIGS